MKPLILWSFVIPLSFGFQPAPKPADLPFTLTWLQGKCIGCKIGGDLESIQFTTPSEAWGVSHAWPPPGGQGLGEYIVVHSKDAGRNWTEIPYTQVHAAPPDVSFLDPENGWLSWLEVVRAEFRLQRTRDGGKTWRDVRLGIDAIPEFVDSSHWYAVDERRFMATDDAGETWRAAQVPLLQYVTQMFFLSPDVGWIVSTDLNAVAVSRTADGGRTWAESQVTTTVRSSQVADLFFVNAMRGWLIVEHGSDEHGQDNGSDLFSTVDGGEIWTPEQDRSFQGAGHHLRPVRFLSERVGFIFDWENTQAVVRSTLIYTVDGGLHWRESPIPRFVSDCQIFKGELRCSASDANSGFWVLTIHVK